MFFSNEPRIIFDVTVNPPFSDTCDHNVVSFCLSIKNEKIVSQPRRLWSKANVPAMRTCLETTNWYNLFAHCRNVDDMWICFRLLCMDLFNFYVPLAKKNNNNGVKYPSRIRHLLRKKSKAFKKRRLSDEHMAKYRQISKTCAKEIEVFHLNRENRILSGDQRSVYKYIRSRLNSRAPVMQLERGNEVFTDNSDIAYVLNDQYCSVFTVDNGYANDLPVKCPVSIDPCLITRNSIISSIGCLKACSTGGVDGMPAWFFKTFPQQLSVPLEYIFKRSLEEGSVPKEWRMSIVTPVYKGSKHKSSDPASYRPISLTCIACRIMERIIKQHIVSHFERFDLFTSSQHGFRNSMSTETQLLECVNDWTNFLDNGEFVDVFYLDVSKAFDTVSHQKLLVKLTKYGIRDTLYKWIESFLYNRVQAVRVDSAMSSYVNVTSGVPQGSVLGPLLFLIYINDLVDVCKYSRVKMFADDSKIYFKCRKLSDRQKLFLDVNRVFQWFSENQLKVAVEKCAVLHLGRTNDCFQYKLRNDALPSVSSVKDLGVIVSGDMKFSDHCSAIAKSAFTISNMFFRSFRSRDRDFMMKFFKTYIRPRVEVSSSVWNPNLVKDINLIESVQRRFTKRIPGLRNISYEHRLTELELDTLESRRLFNDLCMCYKILHGNVNLNVDDFFSFASNDRVRRKNTQNFKIPRCRLDCTKYSFSSRVVLPWNSLPQVTVESPNLQAFKRNLRNIDFSRFLRYSA